MAYIDDYIKKVSSENKAELERILKICVQSVPDVTETISYGMPTLKYKNKMLLSFNAYPNHIGLYPGTAAIVELKGKLSAFSTSKGTIRYTVEKPISDSLIKQIILIRKKAIDNGNKTSL